MLLALAGETADYSLGRDLSLAEADRIIGEYGDNAA